MKAVPSIRAPRRTMLRDHVGGSVRLKLRAETKSAVTPQSSARCASIRKIGVPVCASAKAEQGVIDNVREPEPLPTPEIAFAGLPLEVCEDEQKRQGDKPGYDDTSSQARFHAFQAAG